MPKILVLGSQSHALMMKEPYFPVLWDKDGPMALMHSMCSNYSLNCPKPSPKLPHTCVLAYLDYPNLVLVILVRFGPYDSLNLIMVKSRVYTWTYVIDG